MPISAVWAKHTSSWLDTAAWALPTDFFKERTVTTFSLAAALQLSILAPGADTYAEAYRLTAKTGRPMVVMVGAEWCPACKAMETNVIPQVRRRGVLGRVAFAIVDLDRQRNLGRTLTRGGPIPQLLMFRRSRDGWRLSRLVGGQSAPQVEAFIAGLKRHASQQQTASEANAQAPNQGDTAGESGSSAEPASKS